MKTDAMGIRYIYKEEFKLGKIVVKFEMRHKNNCMGRFGGGWNWHIGAEWSNSTVIFFLLVAMVRIEWK